MVEVETAPDGRQDRRLERRCLSEPEALVLWAMRVWVVGFRSGCATNAPLSRAFAQAGAGDAASLLSGLMLLIGSGANAPLQIGVPCWPSVTPDERRLLDLIAFHQAEGEAGEAAAPMLQRLLSPMAGRLATPVFAALGETLARAGLRVPVPDLPADYTGTDYTGTDDAGTEDVRAADVRAADTGAGEAGAERAAEAAPGALMDAGAVERRPLRLIRGAAVPRRPIQPRSVPAPRLSVVR